MRSAIAFEIRMITVALVKGRLLFVKFWALGTFQLSRNIALASASMLLYFCGF